jgi:hypothetical protein
MANSILSNNALNFKLDGSTIAAGFTVSPDTLNFTGAGSVPVNFQNVNSVTLSELAGDSLVASQAYVDQLVNGLVWMKPVVATSVVNIDLLLLNDSFVIDGVSISTGDRVLLANQTDATKNGIYIVPSAGGTSDADRAPDMPVGTPIRSNATFTQSGTVNATVGFICTNDSPTNIVGTDPLSFIQFTSSDHVQAGNGLSLPGNLMNVNVDATTIVIASDILEVPDAGITNAKLFNDDININPSASAYLTTSTPSIVLGGNTTVDVNTSKVLVTDLDQVITSNKTFADTNFCAFGTLGEMKLSHDGTNAEILNTTGDTTFALSDSIGANKFGVVDSLGAPVLDIDSIGNVTATGDISIAENSIQTTNYSLVENVGDLIINNNITPTWTQVLSGSFRDLNVASAATEIIYTTINGQALRQSLDSGASWSTLSTFTPIAWTDIAITPDGMIVYTSSSSGLQRSVDNGINWTTAINASGATANGFGSVAISDDGVSVICSERSTGDVYLSTDSGTSFTLLGMLPTTAWRNVAMTADGLTMYALYTSQLWASTDGGISWAVETTPGLMGSMSDFAMSGDGSYRTLTGSLLNFRSVSPGVWIQITSLPVLSAQVTVSENGQYQILGFGTVSFTSEDFGVSWSTILPAITFGSYRDALITNSGQQMLATGTSIEIVYPATGLLSIQNTNLTIDGNVHISDSTITSGTTTGAFVVDGGVGVGGSVFVGGSVNIQDTTSSSNFSTGALVVNGGAGIATDMYVNGSISSSSDRRLKKNIAYLNPRQSTELIQRINPVTYLWDDESKNQNMMTGVIAQDLQEILPECVKGENKLAVDYRSLFSVLLSSHQNVIQRIEQLDHISRDQSSSHE